MSVADFADISGFRTFCLSKTEVMKKASAEGLRRDFLRRCPVFVFVYSQEIAREYLFGIFGYLDYIGYPVFWYGQNNILRGLESHMVILADTSWQGSEPQDIVMVPGIQGKVQLWQRILPYVEKLKALNNGAAAIKYRKARIILDVPGADAKVLSSLAGFLNYSGIDCSWNSDDALPSSVFVGRKPKEGLQFVPVFGATDEEVKNAVFRAIDM